MKGLRHRAAVERLGAPGLAGSAALHALVLTTFLLAGGAHARQRVPPVYRVTLLAALGSPPAEVPAATPPTGARSSVPQPPAPRPAPARPAPRERTPAVPLKPAPKPRPQPAAAAKPAASTPATPAAKPQPAALPPSAASSVPGPAGNPNGAPGGSDVATIKTEGVEFPFPGYLHNLVGQVYRRWRPPASNALLEAEVLFFVHRDGTVTGLQFIRRSGSFAFDLEAQGAIEAAARGGAFGVLPAGYGPDVLPVSFYFNPRSAR